MTCLALTPAARAGQTRYHYVPVDAAGNTVLKPAEPGGAPGERVTRFGTVREPVLQQSRPTHLVTFRHPWTGRCVTVPLTLPEGTPRIEYTRTRVVYNYGSYTVEAQFCRDGSVDVVYDTSLLRRP
jgi:hypothetical protein